MKNSIDIDIQIDPTCADPKVVIHTNRITPEIDNIVHAIEGCTDNAFPMVSAFAGEKLVLLSQREIIHVYLERRKLVVCTERGEFVARGTLTDMEALLSPRRFLRISRSEIINLYKVSEFNFSPSGTIQINFEGGSSTWVARRYVRAIKEALGLL